MSLRRMLAIPAVWCLVLASAHAQTLQSSPPSSGNATGAGGVAQPPATQPQDTEVKDGQELTLSGCLMRHREVPSRTNAPLPNGPAKHDGYILVDATTVAHHKGVGGMRPAAVAASAAHDHTATDTPPAVNPAANAGDSQMFKVEGLADADLEPFAGKRVTLMGDLVTDADRQRASAAGAKDTDHDAAPFQATMIHPSSNPCRQ